MDILNLEANLKYTASCGQTLNIEERYNFISLIICRIQLGIALKKLTEHKVFDEVLFWGRIRGNAYFSKCLRTNKK